MNTYKPLLILLGGLLVGALLGAWLKPAPTDTFGTGTSLYKVDRIQATSVSTTNAVVYGTLQALNISTTGTVSNQGAMTLYSTLGVPAALTTLSTLSVTSTASITGALTISTASSTGKISASSLSAGYGGDAMTKTKFTSSTIDVDSLGNGAGTSSVITWSGVTAGGNAKVTRTGSWAAPSSTVNIFAVPGTDSVTLYFQNNSSTAVDLSNSNYLLEYTAY